jgi:hypothetical protein
MPIKKWLAVQRGHLLTATRGAAAVAVAASVTLAVAQQLTGDGYAYAAEFAAGGQVRAASPPAEPSQRGEEHAQN